MKLQLAVYKDTSETKVHDVRAYHSSDACDLIDLIHVPNKWQRHNKLSGNGKQEEVSNVIV